MKTYLVVAGILLSLLNGLLLVPATSTYTAPIAAIALVLSLVILTLSLLGGPQGRTTPGPVPAAAPASLPVTIPPRSQAANQAEAEVVAFFALLQEKGRLVDFLMEDITSYDDTAGDSSGVPRGPAGTFQHHCHLRVRRRRPSQCAGRICQGTVPYRWKSQGGAALHGHTYPQRLEDRIRKTPANRGNPTLAGDCAC